MPGMDAVIDAPSRRSSPVHAGRHFRGWPGAIILGCVLLLCLGSLPWTTARVTAVDLDPAHAPRRYEALRLDRILLPPTWALHAADERERLDLILAESGERVRSPLGTDRLGRDVLTRLLVGGAISLTIGLAAAMLSVVIGTLYGVIAGMSGGRVDAMMMRIVDVLYGLPYVLLVVLLAVAVDGVMQRWQTAAASRPEGIAAWLVEHRAGVNVLTLLIAIGGVSWLTMARVIRGQVLSLREQPYIEACRALGLPRWRIIIRHLLPNLLGPIVVYATLTVPQAILQESFLSFLGIGVQPPLPSWGNMAAEGLSELNPVRSRWWLLAWPCMLLAGTLLSLNFVGERLRDAFDPRRRTTR